jgi:acetyl-CoA acetyltransferase
MREVAVIGVGMTRFGQYAEKSASEHGFEATLAALKDAGLEWKEVQAAFVGSMGVGGTVGPSTLAEVGLTGIPILDVENASASGSAAFRQAYVSVGAGLCDVALSLGVGKMTAAAAFRPGGDRPAQAFFPPAAAFAMRAQRRMFEYGDTADHYAMVSVKNHRHGALNPYAQFQEQVTLEEVRAARMIADPLTVLHCTPRGDGGAAAILCSVERARSLGVDPLITVVASAFRSELHRSPSLDSPTLTETTSREAYEQAGAGPWDMDLIQIHDAFTVEEIDYYEELGLCPRGEGARLIDEGVTAIGGKLPFSTDGGLLARGHPIGPTGLAQVWETVHQLRGTAGARQVEGASIGLCQMIGAGGVCYVHILKR